MIQYDPAISTNILRLCNSPLYPIQRRISSLEEAVVYIGFTEVRRMILLIATEKIFTKTYPGYEELRGELLNHSVACAVISKRLLPLSPPLAADLFTTALLHDIGKMILSDFVGEDYERILGRVKELKCAFSEAEQEIIGTTHAEVGARILQSWNFPEEMTEAVRNHHNPQKVPNSPLTHFVSIANIIAMMMGYTTGIDGLSYMGFPDLYRRYSIKEKTIEKIMMTASDEIATVQAMFS